MDISILVRSNSTVVGSLSALPEPVRFSIAVPETNAKLRQECLKY